MKLKLNRATVSKIVRLFIQDTTKTDGSGLLGLTFATAGLVAYSCREGDVAATAIPLVTTTPGVWVSGGFVAVDAVNLPGIYELGLPNVMLASGNSVIAMLKGAANMAVVLLEIELDAVNYQDGVHMGLTALPNAGAGANNGLPLGNASGQVSLNLAQVLAAPPTTAQSIGAAGSQTTGYALWAAIVSGFGQESLVGTSLTRKLPDGSANVRQFALDSATAPTSKV